MNSLKMWVIYDHPKDFPNSFVAREWLASVPEPQPTGHVMIGQDLEQIRGMLHSVGLVCLDRDENDDPVIVESWI